MQATRRRQYGAPYSGRQTEFEAPPDTKKLPFFSPPPKILNLGGMKDLQGIPEYLTHRATEYSVQGFRLSQQINDLTLRSKN